MREQITGPPDSGKTPLLAEMLKTCEHEKRHSWFHIDMRDSIHLWNSNDGVYKSLLWCFAPRITMTSKTIVPLKPVTFNVPDLQLKEKLVTVKDIQYLLMNAENDLSATPKLGFKPVLFIHKAKYMYCYLNSTEVGQIWTVMVFFIQTHTKQTKKSASSLSMFISRILNNTVNRASVFVIGDLSREESKHFWEYYFRGRRFCSKYLLLGTLASGGY